MRYTSNSKSMKIHAKEKVPVNSKTHLQVKILFFVVCFVFLLLWRTLTLFNFLGSFFTLEFNAQKSLGICKV